MRIRNLGHISSSDHIHVDDPEPGGYLNWIEWAHRQAKAHRTQKLCPQCERYYWPHLGECGQCNGNRAR
jgi:hypothetical protein